MKQQAKQSEPSSSDTENRQLKNNLDLDDYSDDPDIPAANADEGADKAIVGAAAAPQADKKNDDEDYSEDEEQYLAEFDRVKEQQAAQDKEDAAKYGDD